MFLHLFSPPTLTDLDGAADITVGDNICTEDGCARSCLGYVTAPGWDAVTGLGTLKYRAAETYLSNLLDNVLAAKAAAKK